LPLYIMHSLCVDGRYDLRDYRSSCNDNSSCGAYILSLHDALPICFCPCKAAIRMSSLEVMNAFYSVNLAIEKPDNPWCKYRDSDSAQCHGNRTDGGGIKSVFERFGRSNGM